MPGEGPVFCFPARNGDWLSAPITLTTWQTNPILWLAGTLIFSRMRVVRKATISHYPLPLFPSTNYPGCVGIKQHCRAKKSHDTLRSIISHLTSNLAGILGTENQLNYDFQKMNREIQDCWEFSSPKAEWYLRVSINIFQFYGVIGRAKTFPSEIISQFKNDWQEAKTSLLSLFVHRSFNSLECRPTISWDHPA